MDLLWILLGLIFILAGLLGCILPVIPGPPLAYIGLVFLELTSAAPFTTNFMILWLLVAAAVTALDYIVPVWGTRKFGGSKYGTWGSLAGLIIGLFAGPLGIIIGPFLGAFAGELLAGKASNDALKAGFGAFLGFLLGTGIKLVASGMMAWYFFTESWSALQLFFA